MSREDHRRTAVKDRSAELGSSRDRLLDAAARVFARRGYQRATMSEIAAEAGFSKGALYWSFESKEDLFLALLDEHLDRRLRALVAVVSSAGGVGVPDEVGRSLAAVQEEERTLVLLHHEFSAMAARDSDLAERHVERNARLRSELAVAVEAHHSALGVSLTLPPEQLATVVMALINGLSIEQLTDPGAVPDDLLARVLALLTQGMAAGEAGA